MQKELEKILENFHENFMISPEIDKELKDFISYTYNKGVEEANKEALGVIDKLRLENIKLKDKLK